MYERASHQDAWILWWTQNRSNAKNRGEEIGPWKFIWWADASIIGYYDDADVYGWLTVPGIWNWRGRIQ